MRLIRNKAVIDSITAYDFQCEYYVSLYGEYYTTHQQLDFRNLEKLVNARELLPLYISNTSNGIVSNIPDSMQIHINREGINELLNFLMQVKIYAIQEVDQFRRLMRSATNLMALIRKEYHIKGWLTVFLLPSNLHKLSY
jgi:hypothetical protein